MARKASLMSSVKAAKDSVDATVDEFIIDRSDMVTSAMHLPKSTLQLLRKVAVARAGVRGGRPSVSAVLAELIERHRIELEGEIVD